MAMLTLAQILEALSGLQVEGAQQVITDAVVDSRLVIPGALFVALPGEKLDGHAFIEDAIKHGATAVLTERQAPAGVAQIDLRGSLDLAQLATIETPVCLRVENSLLALQQAARFWRSKLSPRVIGITGSVGKSTTKELVADILQRRYRTLKNPGNLNNEIGLPLSILRMTEAHQQAVLEMGFYVPGEIRLLCEIARPQVGVITNISQVHLERAGTLEAIVAGKGELVESLPRDGVAILNHDEQLVRQMAARTQARVFYYGLTPEADLWASEVEGLGLEGIRLTMHYQGEAVHVSAPLLGRHSVHTVLRATAVGLVEGLSWQDIVHGLRNTHAQLRLFAVQGPGGALLLDDTYNAAPPSVIAALNLLEELEGRRIAVLGDMLELGDYEERGHRLVGARAAGVVDELVAVGARARMIADEAQAVGLPPAKIVLLETSEQAIDHLKGRVGEGDVVLVKGSRGMRMDKIISALEEFE